MNFATFLRTPTAQNVVISPNFMVWKFCRKAQFPHSFGRIARNYAETVPFRKNAHTTKLVEITVFYAMTLRRMILCADINHDRLINFPFKGTFDNYMAVTDYGARKQL